MNTDRHPMRASGTGGMPWWAWAVTGAGLLVVEFSVGRVQEGRMPWWAWLVIGIALLAVEMFVIDAQFYLVFLGVAATVVGLVGLAGIAMPEWAQWLLFAGLSVFAMVAFRRRIYEMVRSRSGHVQEPLTLGDRVVVPMRLEPGQTCRVDYRGSSWTARNVDQRAFNPGEEVEIARVEDLTLFVKAPAS
jgi:membrane protein implicated in regulation of membrane protease activity